MFRFQTQTARDARGADIRGGLRQGPLRVMSGGRDKRRAMSDLPQIADAITAGRCSAQGPEADNRSPSVRPTGVTLQTDKFSAD
jgi:hypothetical protein